MEIHGKDLALFQTPDIDTGSQGTEWVTYHPTAPLSENSAIEFSIPGMSNTYVDLERTLLTLKVKITKPDGTAIVGRKGETPAVDSVGLTNGPLHSLFSEVNLSIQQQSVSQIGPNYAYKAYLDILLDTEDDGELASQLFIKDENDNMDSSDAAGGSNNSLFLRYMYTNQGQSVDLIGRLQLDLAQQDRLILNGLPINLKLWQSRDTFRLMAKDKTTAYKLKIDEAYLNVATVRVNPGIIIAHEESLKKGNDALYPFNQSIIKTYSVSKGQYAFSKDDVFQGEVPKKMIVGVVLSSGWSGDYTKNPYNFQNFDCNYIGFYVDGQSVPSHPLQPNFGANLFVEAFHMLNKDGKRKAVDIGRADYKNGFCLYRIDPFGVCKENGLRQNGHTRLELKFGTALPEACTVIVYAKFPKLMRVDASRKVSVE